jgi:hypothetical protein
MLNFKYHNTNLVFGIIIRYFCVHLNLKSYESRIN